MSRVFDVVRNEAVAQLPPGAPLSIAMDDSLLPKSGTHIHGVAWRRDPLGPPFQANLIRAQRVLQLSLALPSKEGTSGAKTIPIDFAHVPTAPKPRHNDPPEAWVEYKNQQKQANLSLQAVSRLAQISEKLENDPVTSNRSVYLMVDGRFTNRAVLKGLPNRMQFIGRIRSDAKLYALPSDPGIGKGRRRSYGEAVPTPEQLRRDESVLWSKIRVFAAGKEHDFSLKSRSCVLWRASGPKRILRLIVIAPLGYRPRKNSKILYRKPAYLITTDITSDLSRILQSYVWRWGIEVNFREEKTLLGVGQAQVRIPASTGNVPAMIVASYAMLLLAGIRNSHAFTEESTLPAAKWSRRESIQPFTTQSLINQLRAELWSKALGVDKLSKFSPTRCRDQNPEKLRPSLPSAVLYSAA